jgi:hypothetical protein
MAHQTGEERSEEETRKKDVSAGNQSNKDEQAE